MICPDLFGTVGDIGDRNGRVALQLKFDGYGQQQIINKDEGA